MKEPIKVFLAGEGKNDLGSRIGHRSWQSDDEPGVLHALLSRAQSTGWIVGGACDWKNIRKYKAKGPVHAETRNVLGVALDAREAGCQILAFSRDQDKDPRRQDAIEEGIRLVPATLSRAPDIIGGVAIPTLEGWILALLGERGTEEMTPRRAEETLSARALASKDGAAMVRIVEQAALTSLPEDARSLSGWLDRARAVLPQRVEG